jgi:methionine--tRNA ligase beta chain
MHRLRHLSCKAIWTEKTARSRLDKLRSAILVPMVTLEDFKKIEVRAGKILSAEKIPETDRLLKLSVDFAEKDELGNPKPRQIVSGISLHFPDPAVLVGKTCMFVANLEPRTIKGIESNGMLFAVSTPEGAFSLLEPNDLIPPGTLAV